VAAVVATGVVVDAVLAPSRQTVVVAGLYVIEHGRGRIRGGVVARGDGNLWGRDLNKEDIEADRVLKIIWFVVGEKILTIGIDSLTVSSRRAQRVWKMSRKSLLIIQYSTPLKD
jgi:hypothetical protein